MIVRKHKVSVDVFLFQQSGRGRVSGRILLFVSVTSLEPGSAQARSAALEVMSLLQMVSYCTARLT